MSVLLGAHELTKVVGPRPLFTGLSKKPTARATLRSPTLATPWKGLTKPWSGSTQRWQVLEAMGKSAV
jgi:hypothetical protein